MRSDWRTREMKTFLSRDDIPAPPPLGEVRMRVVSEPASGSVTAKACSRSSPDAIPGRKRRFCSLRAVPQHGAHRVHLRVAGGGVGAGAVDFLQDDARLPDAQPHPSVLLGDQTTPGILLRSARRRTRAGRSGLRRRPASSRCRSAPQSDRTPTRSSSWREVISRSSAQRPIECMSRPPTTCFDHPPPQHHEAHVPSSPRCRRGGCRARR